MLTRQLNERQRMQYLEALGVDSFSPRWALPGAQPSRQCRLPEADAAPAAAQPEPATAQKPQERTSGAGSASVGALVDQLLDKPATARPKPASAPAQVAAQPASAPAEEAAFSLAFWRVHPDVMIVDTRQAKLLPTEALLTNLLVALNLGHRLPRPEVQSWPLPGIADRSWSAAREMIHAFLEGRLLSQPVRHLVLMGAGAAKSVLDQPAPELGRVTLDSFACDAFVTPSLAELLLEPGRKREMWRLMSALRSREAGSP